MELFTTLLQIILAGVFLTAGIGKLLDRDGSRKALEEFGVPQALLGSVASVLPWAEIVLAGTLLIPQTQIVGALGAVLLLALFTIGMLVQYTRGNAPDCHCFGQIHSEPVGIKSIIRNSALLLVAIALAASELAYGNLRGTTEMQFIQSTDPIQVAVALAAIALLIAIFVVLRKISEQQDQIIRRIEILEVISSEGREIEREEIGEPPPGLPLGSPIPEFEVTGEAGIAIPSNDLVAGSRPALLLFVSPTCSPCEALVPEVREWVEEFEGRLDFVLISSGDWAENVEKFGESLAESLFLQRDKEAADLLSASWTPTAVLLDGRGRIASRNAVGDSAIKELIDGVRETELGSDYLFYPNGQGEGLKIGDPVPEFRLEDLDGNEISSEQLKGRKTVAAFWSTTCPFCMNMIEELKEWTSSKDATGPELILFSAGDKNVHRELGLSAPIVIEDDYETAGKLGMNGTPSAVIIDESGRIASETGIGAANIWALLGETLRYNKARGK